MQKRLTRTYLSTRPTRNQVYFGLLCLSLLLLIHSLSPSSWMASGKEVFINQQYWKLFTTSLIHSDLSHLGHNALFFTGLAILLNSYFGWLIFPFFSLFMGGLINYVTLSFYEPQIYLVGISGVIYFMAAFWMIHYIGIERKISLTRRFINCVALVLILLFPHAFEAKVSYLAHGVGFGSGALLAIPYFLFHRKKYLASEVWEIIPEVEDIELADSTFTTLDNSDNLKS
jgi:rhomboid protease GluP